MSMIIYYSFLLIITPRDVIVTEQFFARLNMFNCGSYNGKPNITRTK